MRFSIRTHCADCRSGNLRVRGNRSFRGAAMGPFARALFHGGSRDESSRIRNRVPADSIRMDDRARNRDAGSDHRADHALPVDSRERFDFRRAPIVDASRPSPARS